MTIPTNLGSGGPDLQSVVDGSSEHYQGTVAVQSVLFCGGDTAGGLITPTDVVVNIAANGNNELLAAQPGARIHVLAGVIMASAAVGAYFRDGTLGAGRTGIMPLEANIGFQIPYVPVGNFRTSINTPLVLNLDAAVSVDGWLICAVI